MFKKFIPLAMLGMLTALSFSSLADQGSKVKFAPYKIVNNSPYNMEFTVHQPEVYKKGTETTFNIAAGDSKKLYVKVPRIESPGIVSGVVKQKGIAPDSTGVSLALFPLFNMQTNKSHIKVIVFGDNSAFKICNDCKVPEVTVKKTDDLAPSV